MTEKKLIYILNSYSQHEASHFEHVFNLLEVIANKGVEISLIIEKLEGSLTVDNKNIKVFSLSSTNPILRQLELYKLIKKLIDQGYVNSFVRISAWATISVSLAHFFNKGESYLWQSGTTHEYDWSRPLDKHKIKWFISSFVPNLMARELVTWFVTGPELMVDYYTDVVKIPRKKIKLLYNDIQLERFTSSSLANSRKNFIEEHRLDKNVNILLLVHRLSPVRKTLMYLEPLFESMLAQKLDNWVLVIAGAGAELPEAKKLASSLDLTDKVIFLGNVANKEIPILYATADLFINPTFTEGFPRVVIEAMASGLPIVSTNAGGTSQLTGPLQVKYITPKENPKIFVESAIKLLNEPSEWDILRKENLEYVKRFSTENVADMYIRVIFDEK